ncbi:YdeI/OmpD-associated family protein [Pseudarthrobacter sp. AL07]|uniref:YdeI/OmpD-associated family protein n=1 Tax=unclassified Pseudarthrobacter TaxID=2647000 RepID=UPI00249C463E|nr:MULTISPECIES: YdeI/OmpD-associated family protein [unclassified Pseudarthrobacter]MDI3194176.1 YdeI/OmpD-associated family protein [Pseudarthrobacter sp. AL20]MDI3208242.1 YdeI/OmpD-associated family protein [Pseudarthrobacter sp. AL07]
MAIELEELLVADAAEWRLWLEANHNDSPGVWLVLHKKGGNTTELDYEAALQEALCFGWIDGQGKRRDDGSSFQRMTRRGPKSVWSARNVDRIGKLEAAGRMTVAGRAAVGAAKADGRWEAAYVGQATAEVPPDLAAAIAAVPEAQAMFDVLTSVNRYALIYRTNSVKQASTRERKIAGFVEMLARSEAPYPQKKKPHPTE